MVDQTREPAWWTELIAAPDNDTYAELRIRASIPSHDIGFLVQVVEGSDGQELRRAAALLTSMLRGRFPAVMHQREMIARKMLQLASNGFPENERARRALSVLIYADREAASRLVETINFGAPIAPEDRELVAYQLNTINTQTSIEKLHEMLSAQGDQMLRLRMTPKSYRYVPVEELAIRWKRDNDIVTLNLLCQEWLNHIYEGYPLAVVTDMMGSPQHRPNPQAAYYVSKQGPALYLEINDAGQICGWHGPK